MDYKNLTKYIATRFSSCYTNDQYYNNIGEWLEWYKGYVKSFHTAKVSNGLTCPKREVYQLRMAKRVAEDWASAICNEDVKIVVSDDNIKSSIFLQGTRGNAGVLGSNNFNQILSTSLEQSFALGTCAIVLDLENIGVDSNGNIINTSDALLKLSSYNATRIVPISWKNGIITECAFISEFTIKGKTIVLISSHILESDGYVIYNELVNSEFKTVSLETNILPIVRTKSLKPLFTVYKPNIANNIDLDSPLGISVYSNAIDCLKSTDLAYDACIRDVITGQRIILMNKCLLTTDDNGNPIAPQDVKQTYMQFFGDEASSDTSEFIKEFTPALNSDKLDAELQNQLNMLSFKTGLGTHYYNFSRTGGITATEYAGERQDFVRNVRKMNILVINSITALVKEILNLGYYVLNQNINPDAKIEVQVSDGIIEDDSKEREQDRLDVQNGIMSKIEYRAKWYGESLDTASQKVDEARRESGVVKSFE